MWMQIAVGAGWLLWLSSGTAGLEKGLTVGALLVLGLGLKNILDTFWKYKASEPKAEVGIGSSEPLRSLSRPRSLEPSESWNGSRTNSSTGHPALRGFERRFADPRA